jgi:hypothetical protein
MVGILLMPQTIFGTGDIQQRETQFASQDILGNTLRFP